LLRSIKTRLELIDNVKLTIEGKNRELRNKIILAVPHELRTPLTAILGFSDILTTESAEMERAHITDMAQHINRAANRLHRLVENYLVYAQIEVAIHDPHYHQLFNASQTFDSKILIEEQAIRKAQEYDRESDLVLDICDLKTIYILDDYLKKIIDELVDNAFKFSDPGMPVKVTLREEKGWALLSVANNGCGISAEQIRNLGKYVQFDRELFEQQGTGLGLTIAQRIAEIHGGQLEIESIPDQRTDIIVRLRLDSVE
jgi:signal transduction histidine kinase